MICILNNTFYYLLQNLLNNTSELICNRVFFLKNKRYSLLSYYNFLQNVRRTDWTFLNFQIIVNYEYYKIQNRFFFEKY